jgi:hypothetical protein
MGRPEKTGLDYFPLDVDIFEDPKLLFVEDEHGPKGGYIAIRLLCWIYRNGYYASWDTPTALLFARKVGNGVTAAEVQKVVECLIKHQFFNADMYATHQILTSYGIQKRWMRITEQARRKGTINPLYKISHHDHAPVSSEETPVSSEETRVDKEETTGTPEESTQSTVQYSKAKEITHTPAFLTMPLPANVGPLPEVKVAAAIEFYWHVKRVRLVTTQISGLWEIFKIQNLTGKKYYADEGDVHSHFINWIKSQDIPEENNPKQRGKENEIDHREYMEFDK